MKIRKMSKRIIICILAVITILSLKLYAATELESIIKPAEYTEQYKQWLNLSDEEKEKVLEPRKYNIIPSANNTNYLKNMNNALRVEQLLKSTLSNKYTLQTIIPENIKIKNQMQTNSCWAFASIGALETSLALQDKLASKSNTVYDFSEKHMNYATTRDEFLNNAINENSFSRKLKDGGNFYIAQAYLTNGRGAIPESELLFENSEEKIDIAQIQNKTISTTLYDTVEFEVPTSSTKQDVITKMKQHITNYGGIYAGVYGAEIISDNYNNVTGAIYCSSNETTPANHAVTIIGWDDDYEVDNFNSKNRPTNKGAWIVKNSWGEKLEEILSEVKADFYSKYTTQCNEKGWNSAEEIPTDFISMLYEEIYGKGKVAVTGDKLVLEMGDKGFMYISYDDANIYESLCGIKKATNKKDYYNIYQNDELGVSDYFVVKTREKIYLANVFTRNTSIKEALNKVSIYTIQGYKYKVFVNPNGSSKSLSDLQEVNLLTGNTETIEPGYNTIEFAEPIELKGEKFAVVLELSCDESEKAIAIEKKIDETWWASAKLNSGESFFTTETNIKTNVWQDLATLSNTELRGNVCIKALTTNNLPTTSITLQKIEVSTKPTKLKYIQNKDKLDLSGGKIKATYSNGTTKEIDMKSSEVTSSGFDNTKLGKQPIVVTYNNKTATFEVEIIKDNGTSSGDKTDQDPEGENKKEPVNSDFSNVIGVNKETEYYFYKNNTNNSYTKMKIKISNIKIGDESDTYTYYYYISGTQGDTVSDSKWKKVNAIKEADGTYSIVINVKTNELENANNIALSENLYVYIKEVAEINGKSKQITKSVKIDKNKDTTETYYLDDKKVSGLDEILAQIGGNNQMDNNNNSTDNKQNQEDKTTAPGVLPQTGILPIIITLVIAIAIIGSISYLKFKNIDK